MPDKDLVIKRFSEVLENQWLTNMGPSSLELEEHICELLGVKHCVVVCNGTIGLELLQRALDLNGEVIIPAFTFVATAHSLRWQHIDPVFCDVKLDDHLIDPDKVEELITPKTTGIMAVPIWGQPCANSKLQDLAYKYGLKLIYDSAHGFGCKDGDCHIGTFGDAEVFSFHATKVFSTGEGGAITTNSDKLAEKLRLMRNFGFTNLDRVDHIGTNAKMSEFAAAYGLANLPQLDSIISHNKLIHQTYLELFSGMPEISFLQYNFNGRSNYQYVVARVPKNKRDSLLSYFHRHDVLVRRYFFPGCHRMQPYLSEEKYIKVNLDNTETIASEILIFPTGQQMKTDDVSFIRDLYLKFTENVKNTP